MRSKGGTETVDDLTQAYHYRDEATRLRKLATEELELETRECILAVAIKYDGLCDKYLMLATPSRR